MDAVLRASAGSGGLAFQPGQVRDEAEAGGTREQLAAVIGEGAIQPHFQPIVDLVRGECLGYEILSRVPAFRDTAGMFRKAASWGMGWDLEYACRIAALWKVSRLTTALRNRTFFLNVSPTIFNDPRFFSGFTLTAIGQYGIDKRRIVLEITEAATVDDYRRFESLVAHYVAQGFRIALDDFGSGHSGLITLIAATPQFIKLDRALIADIDRQPYKQSVVRSMAAFAENEDCSLVAEGIERREELEILCRMGVRYGQGYLLGRPAAEPEDCSAEAEGILRDLRRRRCPSGMACSAKIRERPETRRLIAAGELTCGEMDGIFRGNPLLEYAVIVERDRPCGLVTRGRFQAQMGGQFGFHVFKNRPVDVLARTEMLVVGEDADLQTVGRLAMERCEEDLWDPVLVTESAGRLVGSYTMKQVLTGAIDLEVKIASSRSPLTGLPGNLVIGLRLKEALANPPCSAVYADLDRFKEYNDAYGFARGDEMIRFTARFLELHSSRWGPDAWVGHIGGDDFVAVLRGEPDGDALEDSCTEFDVQKGELFDVKDSARGFYVATDRAGRKTEVPLVTLSLAVVTSANLGDDLHEGMLSRILSDVKKRVKAGNLETGRSGWMIDRRRPSGGD